MVRDLAAATQQSGLRGGYDSPVLPRDPSGARGQAGQFSFFSFPPEIRNMIYDFSLQRPDCAQLYQSYYKQALPPHQATRPHRWRLGTPTILLLCRGITDESLPVLMARRFVIDRLPPCIAPIPGRRGGFLRLNNFIGRETLQRLQYIDLRVGLGEGPLGSGWIWNRVLDELLAVLNERNALAHFHLLIRRCNQSENRSIWPMEAREEQLIRKKISYFQMTNPNVFRPCKITVETWRIDGQQATFLGRLCLTGAREDFKPPSSRSYPDRELFPGSIMQFVGVLPRPL